MNWSKEDLEKIKSKGFKVNDDLKVQEIKIPKQTKISVEKNTIELYLRQLTQSRLIDDFLVEYQFTTKRKYRFDYFIPCLNLGIEYDGLMSKKSRHTTIGGFSEDCVKLNLATTLGYKILRYTALNYQNCYTDIEKIINQLNT